jgi:hypothetical protein
MTVHHLDPARPDQKAPVLCTPQCLYASAKQLCGSQSSKDLQTCHAQFLAQ